MSWQVFKRDATRLLRVPKVWIIVIGVLVTPALYAWFNINAFWDPYANTANIRVAVVNLDEGADSEITGPLDVGAQVVDELEGNEQLGWVFMDEDRAQDAVRSGEVYAAIVIPADFSDDLVSITTGEFTQPALQYFVNEKAGAIAPKITDVGASGLDRQITSAFTSQVARAATEAITDAGSAAELRLLGAKGDTLDAFDEATQRVAAARGDLAELSDGLAASRDALNAAGDALDDVDRTLGDVQTAIEQAQPIIDEAQRQVVAFTDAATTAYVDGATRLADVSAAAHVAVSQLTQAFETAGVRIDGAIDEVAKVVDANAAAIDRLQALVDGGDLDPAVAQRLNDAIDALEERNRNDRQLLEELQRLNGQASDTAAAVQSSADAVDEAVQNAQGAASDLRSVLTASVPELSRAMSALSTSAGAFSAALDAQRTQLGSAQELLTNLDAQLVSTSTALTGLDGNLAGIQDGLRLARTDVVALGAASEWSTLQTLTGLDAEQIAQFVASPVEVAEHAVFPVANYGSAMAALFTNLSLWIGAFVLMVIFKTEVDTEGVEGVTVRQAYFGRFLLFAALAVGQALVVCIGNLVIGVQLASAVAFVATGVVIALAYVSIVYALCVAFGHVGRALCILLVIMQIPGASGLYPIEMMPGFFRALYPFLPFTYGIDAMRETIAGFYDGHYWGFIGALMVFVALAFVLGLVLRRRLANLNRLFNREIAATGLLIGEDVQVVGAGYRLGDVIRALSDRHEYRDDLARRARPFTRNYPSLLRTTLLVGAGGLAVIGVIAWLVPGGKASLLGVWVLWCLLVIAALVTLEYVKQSFELAAEVGRLDEAELRRAVLGRPSFEDVAPEPAFDDVAPESEDVAPEDVAPEDVESEDLALDDLMFEDLEPEDLEPEDLEPEDFEPENLEPEDFEPEDFEPGHIEPEEPLEGGERE